jgi:hypothetical protein
MLNIHQFQLYLKKRLMLIGGGGKLQWKAAMYPNLFARLRRHLFQVPSSVSDMSLSIINIPAFLLPFYPLSAKL